MRNFEPYQYLPTYAKVAIDWLDCNSHLRNTQNLDQALEAYAKTYGVSVDDHIRASAHYICSRRFGETFVV